MQRTHLGTVVRHHRQPVNGEKNDYYYPDPPHGFEPAFVPVKLEKWLVKDGKCHATHPQKKNTPSNKMMKSPIRPSPEARAGYPFRGES
jgi:hypothetical protein